MGITSAAKSSGNAFVVVPMNELVRAAKSWKREQ